MFNLSIQVQFFFSCLTQKGNTPVDSGGAGTPLPLPIRACLVLRSEWATIGPTTPCWPKPGGLVCWGTRNWPTACCEISQTFVPTRKIDWWPSGKVAWRKWTPVPLEKRVEERQYCVKRKQILFAYVLRANVLVLSSNQREIKQTASSSNTQMNESYVFRVSAHVPAMSWSHQFWLGLSEW